MRSRSHSDHPSIIKEIDVLTAPMPTEHKHLVLRHFRRLRKIIDEDDEDAIGRYTSKQAAREQLARMTLVFRDYTARYSNGEIDDDVKSMVADVVDASFFVGGQNGTFHQPAFPNALLHGREQEIAILMQELQAGNVDDVVELWNVQPTNKNVLPDAVKVDHLGRDIDWTRVLCRSSSEDDLLHCRSKRTIVKNKPKVERTLSQRNLADLDRTWPPVTPDPELFQGRARAETETSFWSEQSGLSDDAVQDSEVDLWLTEMQA